MLARAAAANATLASPLVRPGCAGLASRSASRDIGAGSARGLSSGTDPVIGRIQSRRAFFGVAAAAFGALVCGPGVAQSGPKRIGELSPFPLDDPTQRANAETYTDAFRQRGWVLGRNLDWLKRTGPRDAKGWDEAARELVAAGVDLIVTTTDAMTGAALRATRTTPVVGISGAPVELGFAQSLARPGGNFTGVSFQSHDENGKAIELLRGIRPGLQRIGVPVNRDHPVWRAWFDSMDRVATPAGMRMVALPPPAGAGGIAPMLDAAAGEQVQALILPTLPFLDTAAWQQITAWAVKHRVVTRGSLLSRGEAVLAFGSNVPALLRLHVEQIDRVLRGANPADTPILQPTVWDTVINQKLARAVGWPAPPMVLLQATEVIE